MAYLQNWDNKIHYSDIEDAKIAADVELLNKDVALLADDTAVFTAHLDADNLPEWDAEIAIKLAEVFAKIDLISPRIHNLSVYVQSVATIDSGNVAAKKLISVTQNIGAAIGQAFAPVMVFLTRVSDGFIDELYKTEFIEPFKFKIDYGRKYKDQLLSVEQENLLTAMAQNGLQTWGNLYNELSASLTAEVNGQTYGLAKIYNMQSDTDRSIREQAWRGTQQAWSGRAETAAAIVNSINGWRIEERKKRSVITEYHYLDEAVRDSHVSRKTLDAMMSVTYKRRDIGHRALAGIQKHLKLDQLKPWDLSAPAPVSKAATYTYDEAIDLIAKCFSAFNPEMGAFVVMMAEKGWIDAEPTDTRRTGAYCTGFSEPREPRVFMTFEGTMTNVTTLAHELGHAWHNWVMRDMHDSQTQYPMTLAETASIFAENLVRDYLFSHAKDDDARLLIGWNDAEMATAMLNNIPARFDFERELVEARQTGFVPEPQLVELMQSAWGKWYGDSLSEYDPYFWATKLHFSISGMGFYNYPYLFGYLFSLGVYQQKDELGNRFNDLYTGLLRDTGSMTAEQVVMKHLQKDIEGEAFWDNSLDMVEAAINQFEALDSK
ncbi:MAG: M3 family oligoendopeptidase [Rhizobiales bacterium]|nr:M3 family oligoendopeptidase [Hyphomicrobiales bacterium]NRB14461.1 M3 family oligoendopeptidase [Hyphomicrobiales bacterium]